MRRIEGWRLLGEIPALLRDPLTRLSNITSGSEDIHLFRVGMYATYLLNSPEQVKRVMHENPANYNRSDFLTQLMPLIGRGLFSSDEETWVEQRKLLAGAFRPEGDEALAGIVREELARALPHWHAKAREGAMDLEHLLKRLCLGILCRSMFSPDVDADRDAIIHDLNRILQFASYRSQILRQAKNPLRRMAVSEVALPGAVSRALTGLNTFIYGVIDQCADKTCSSGRLMELIAPALASGEISRVEARDHIATFLFAGFDTVAEMLTWSLHLLATHPEVQADLWSQVAETDEMASQWSVLPDGRGDLLQHVLFEALRLYPPAWAVFRRPIEDDDIAGQSVKQKTCVMVCPYTMQRNPRHWESPDHFKPERYRDKPDPAAYIPFGFGKHTCIGRRAAILEGRMILAELIRNFSVRVEHDPVPRIRPGVIIQSAKPLKFRLQARSR